MLFILRITLWHVDPLLGNDREISNYKTIVTRQGPVNGNREMVFSVRSVPTYAQDKANLMHKPALTGKPCIPCVNVT
jgi:hypothetical protein